MNKLVNAITKRSRGVTATDLVLTLPDKEAEFVRETYAAANNILEFGSGGSTMEAAKLGKPVTAVESDQVWAQQLSEVFAEMKPSQRTRVVHFDIGKTRKWGTPSNTKGFRNYHQYALGIWDDPDFAQPDVVLIDGRFRVACFCGVVMRTTRPVRVLFDDYTMRPYYHVVERLVKPTKTVGRMAVFDVPAKLDTSDQLTWIAESFVDFR